MIKLKNSISFKLVAFFILTIVLMITLTFYSVYVSKEIVTNNIGNNSILIADEMFKRLDQELSLYINLLLSHTHSLEIQNFVNKSNYDFKKISNLHTYITLKNQEWIMSSNADTDLLKKQVTNNNISQFLNYHLIENYMHHYGYSIITNFILTNQHGVNIAASENISDYYQADEEWWKYARQEEIFLSDIIFDIKSSLSKIIIASRIEDAETNFLGVLYVELDVKALLQEAEISTRRYQTTQVRVITHEGNVIYSTIPYHFFNDISDQPFYKKIVSNKGYFTGKLNENKTLFSYTTSRKYSNLAKYNWILIISHRLEEVLYPSLSMQNRILGSSIILITFIIFIAIYISKLITKPLKNLTNSIELIGQGNLDQKVNIESKDEIGILARTFNEMLTKRKKAEDSLNIINKQLTSNLKYFESMDIISNTTSKSENIDTLMEDIIEDIFKIFNPDRVWILYPCDPNAKTFIVPYEKTVTKYPGAGVLKKHLPMDTGTKKVLSRLIVTTKPICVDHKNTYFSKSIAVTKYFVLSQIAIAIHPRIGKAWCLGMHQCSFKREWTNEEQKLFQDISLKIADALSNLLLINSLKKSEESLKKSEEGYRAIAENTPVLICRFLPDSTISYANQAYCQYFSKNPKDLIGSSFLYLIPENTRDNVMKNILSLTVESPTQTHEHPVITPNNVIRWQRWTNRAMFNKEGKVSVYQAIGEDITERKKAEEALKESEKRFRELFNNMNNSVVIYEAVDNGNDFIIQDFNKPAEKLSKKSKIEIKGKRMSVAFPGITKTKFYKILKKVWKSGKSEAHFGQHYKNSLYDIWYDQYTYRLPSGEVVTIYNDITEKKKAEEKLYNLNKNLEKLVDERTQQLVLAERLAATGRLAASIAHVINNPLQGINSHLDLMKDGLPDDSKKIKNYNHVKSNITKISEIVKQLLDIYRNTKKEKTSIDINGLVNKIINLVSHQLRIQDISLKLSLMKHLPMISGWHQQLHQVILNILLNSIDSITSDGEIYVSTFYDKEFVKIQITDNGKGIDSKDIDHIFDPFFSTKQDSGVGLGLFVCKGLINNHNGEITVTSKKDKGSTFTIILPRS